MRLLTTTAILLAVSGAALAQSEDWFTQQANAGAPSSQMTEKQAMKEAIRYVDKTKLGKEYKAMEKAIVAGRLSASDPNFLATQIRYEAVVTRVAAGKMAISGNWNNAYGSDNQPNGAKNAASQTGGNAHMSDKAR